MKGVVLSCDNMRRRIKMRFFMLRVLFGFACRYLDRCIKAFALIPAICEKAPQAVIPTLLMRRFGDE